MACFLDVYQPNLGSVLWFCYFEVSCIMLAMDAQSHSLPLFSLLKLPSYIFYFEHFADPQRRSCFVVSFVDDAQPMVFVGHFQCYVMFQQVIPHRRAKVVRTPTQLKPCVDRVKTPKPTTHARVAISQQIFMHRYMPDAYYTSFGDNKLLCHRYNSVLSKT